MDFQCKLLTKFSKRDTRVMYFYKKRARAVWEDPDFAKYSVKFLKIQIRDQFQRNNSQIFAQRRKPSEECQVFGMTIGFNVKTV